MQEGAITIRCALGAILSKTARELGCDGPTFTSTRRAGGYYKYTATVKERESEGTIYRGHGISKIKSTAAFDAVYDTLTLLEIVGGIEIIDTNHSSYAPIKQKTARICALMSSIATACGNIHNLIAEHINLQSQIFREELDVTGAARWDDEVRHAMESTLIEFEGHMVAIKKLSAQAANNHRIAKRPF